MDIRIFQGSKSHIRVDANADGRTGAPWLRTLCGREVPPTMTTRGNGIYDPDHHCSVCWNRHRRQADDDLTLPKLWNWPSDALQMQYPGQYRPQRPLLELSEDGEITVLCDPEIGDAVPMDVWHGRRRRFALPYGCRPRQVHRLLRAIRPLLVRIHRGMDIRWDGSNQIGVLTADAESAERAVKAAIFELETRLWEAAQ